MSTRVKQISEDIYWIYNPSYYNCTYLVKRGDRVILIDTCMQSDASDIKKAFKQLSLPVESISDILLTHWHNDHSAGTAELKAISNCTIYCQKEEAPYFEKKPSSKIRQLAEYIPERGILVLLKGLLGEVVPRNVKIDRLLKDGDEILNDFIVLESPGHTHGHISFYDKKSKTLFAGDSLAVIKQHIRLMAGVVTPDKPASITSILKLLEGRAIHIICPGHREPLVKNTKSEIIRFLDQIKKMKKWPILG